MAILRIPTGELIGLLIAVAVCVYFWFQYKFSYWARKSVQGPAPVFPFGNIRDVIRRRAQFFQPYCDSYYKYKHLPYAGMYSFHRPVLCVHDPDVAKLILIKDFDHFQAHGIFAESPDPLARHLFNIHGKQWKDLRFKMTTAFSPGKLKGMYPLLHHIANEGLNHLESLATNGKSIDITNFYETYTMEIIASCGFGVECNGFNVPNVEFHSKGNEYFKPNSVYWTCIRVFAFFAPDLFKMLKIRRFSPTMINFFYSLVKETVEYRQKNAYRRNDFIQTLIDLKNAHDPVDENDNIREKSDGFQLTLDDLAANTMLYMVAGYETSATVGQFTAYELALNPHIQDKAREEVVRVLAKYNGECTYEAQHEMTYLNMVFDETMRKYPPMRALFRRCNKEYKLPDSDLVIDEGTLVIVPCQAIQMDPEIFPNPDKFDPDRFLPDNKSSRHPCHWMPFGEGPRKCLGLRQGYIQVKVALAKILQNYELSLDERTLVPMKLNAASISAAPEGHIWIKLRKNFKNAQVQ